MPLQLSDLCLQPCQRRENRLSLAPSLSFDEAGGNGGCEHRQKADLWIGLVRGSLEAAFGDPSA